MKSMESESKVTKYCKICDFETEHEKGNFKLAQKGSDLFESRSLFADALKEASPMVLELIRMNNSMKKNPGSYLSGMGLQPEIAKLGESIFPTRIKAFKCIPCGHLIPLPKLP